MSLPDHIGWDLVRAARIWEAAFVGEVVRAGYPWFAEARGRLVQHIGPDGVDQGALAERVGHSKQAVAQALDRLEADGLIRREGAAGDGRRRRVVWTPAGQVALAEIDRAKLRVEARLKQRLGAEAFEGLRRGLKGIVETRQVD